MTPAIASRPVLPAGKTRRAPLNRALCSLLTGLPLSLFDDLVFEAGVAARSLAEYLGGGGLRLGVTGLSRAGKTVFITALVNNLIARARLPVLAASAEGRIARATAGAAARRCGAALRL